MNETSLEYKISKLDFSDLKTQLEELSKLKTKKDKKAKLAEFLEREGNN
ncbi:hypothetical protein [Methanosarcina siciliae]|nr:hypothetical protein [Methanosarcina siciliae]